MSLYIGQDENGKGILHITSSSRSENEMKSGLFDDTVFHNKKTYQSFEIYPIESVAKYDTNSKYSRHFTHVGNSAQYYYEKVHYWRLKGYSLPYGATDWFILDEDYNVVITPNYVRWTKSSLYVGPGYTTDRDSFWRSINAPIGLASVGTFSLPGAYVAVLKDTTPIYDYGITINSSDILIGGESIGNYKYVYTGGILNNHESSIQIDAARQLIDASKIEGSIKIESSSGTTIVSKGDYPIFSSKGGFSNKVSENTYLLDSGDIVPETFSVGDNVKIDCTFFYETGFQEILYSTYLTIEEGAIYGATGYRVNGDESFQRAHYLTFVDGELRLVCWIRTCNVSCKYTYMPARITVARYA